MKKSNRFFFFFFNYKSRKLKCRLLQFLFAALRVNKVLSQRLHSPSVLADMPILVKCSIISPTFMGSEETSSYWSVLFFSGFHWSPSVGKPLMILVSFVKTTESYKVCR